MSKTEALRIFKDEHGSIAAVIHALEFLVGRIQKAGVTPDFRLLNAIVCYIREYPEKLHHPAEDTSLFQLVRSRTSVANNVLDELQQEHGQGEERLQTLSNALNRFEAGATDSVSEFAEAVRAFADFYWRHMRKEEDLVLPIAEQALTEDDWKLVRDAFLANRDPMLGGDTADEFRNLFSRILKLAPPPIGYGDSTK